MAIPPPATAVKWLLIANVAVFVLHYLVLPFLLQPFGIPPRATAQLFVEWFGFIPARAVAKLCLWQFVTYLFLHGGIGHIFLNMLVLWLFGSDLERVWGPRAFLRYYFVTGIGAACFQIPVAWDVPSVGASGAIYGLLVAFAMLFPNRMIYLYFFIPVRAKWFVIAIVALELWLGFKSPHGGVAHLAHFGGAIVGFLYLKRVWRIREFVDSLRWKRRRSRFQVIRDDEPFDTPRGGRIDPDDWVH